MMSSWPVYLLFILGFFSVAVHATDFYSFTVTDTNGEDVSLEKYRGQVTLVINVASHCGYTESTYKALTKIHDILSYEGLFSVLAFPCNQFGEQEPDDAATVSETMKAEYGLEFPIFDKIDVLGENACPAFRNLIEQTSKTPEWNFYKYLVGPDGTVLNAWGTRTEIEEIFQEVQDAVNAAKSSASAAGKSQDTETVPEKPEEVKEEL